MEADPKNIAIQAIFKPVLLVKMVIEIIPIINASIPTASEGMNFTILFLLMKYITIDIAAIMKDTIGTIASLDEYWETKLINPAIIPPLV